MKATGTRFQEMSGGLWLQKNTSRQGHVENLNLDQASALSPKQPY